LNIYIEAAHEKIRWAKNNSNATEDKKRIIGGAKDKLHGLQGEVIGDHLIKIVIRCLYHLYFTWIALIWKNMLPPDTDSEEEVAAPKDIELTQLA